MWIIFIISVMAGFILYSVLSGSKEGEAPKVGNSIKIWYSPDKYFHLHHWFLNFIILMTIGIVVSISMNPCEKNETIAPWIIVVSGLLFGGTLQGLAYSDHMHFLYKKVTIANDIYTRNNIDLLKNISV